MMFNTAKILINGFGFSIGDEVDVKCERGIYKFKLKDGRWDYWSDNVDDSNKQFFKYFELIYDEHIKDDYSHLVRLLKNL